MRDCAIGTGKVFKCERKNRHRLTPLHRATWNGHGAVVRCLHQEGANPSEIDDEDETALPPAAWRGHANVLKLLLDEDADQMPEIRLDKLHSTKRQVMASR